MTGALPYTLPQLRSPRASPKARPSQGTGSVVRLLRRHAEDRKALFGFLGLKVGLSVPAPDLNWELVVLDGTRARVVGNGPAVRLRRGDRILAVQEVTELRDMIASLAALDTGGPEVVELRVDLRTLPAAQRAAENAVPLVCKGFQMNPSFEEDFGNDALLPLPSCSQPTSESLAFESRRDQTMMARLRRIIRDLGPLEAARVLEKLTRNNQPSFFNLSPADPAADAVEFEAERLSETLLRAAGLAEAVPTAKAGGRHLWEALVNGRRGAEASGEDLAAPLGGMWLEALFHIGAVALSMRREEILLYADAWCTRTIQSEWHQQLEEIEETIGWVSQQVDHLKARAQQVLVMRRFAEEPEGRVGSAASPFPKPSPLSLRWAMLKKPARDLVRDLAKLRPGPPPKPDSDGARKSPRRARAGPKGLAKPIPLLSFDQWLRGPGRAVLARYEGHG